MSEFRRRVGLVFQDPDVQLFSPTVWDEVIFGPLQLGITKDEVVSRGREVLDLLQIGHLKERPPYMLSGGEKKKVSLASVLSLRPQVLLLDEPTTGLDPRSQGNLIDFLLQWAAKNTISWLTVSRKNSLTTRIFCYGLTSSMNTRTGTKNSCTVTRICMNISINTSTNNFNDNVTRC
jgi:energy-coupling factor transporter ATP-binding protein EcfA2